MAGKGPRYELMAFRWEVADGVPSAVAVFDAIAAAGGHVPSQKLTKAQSQQGHVTGVKAAGRILATDGAAHLERVVRIALAADCTPVDSTAILGIHALLIQPGYPETLDTRIAEALGHIMRREELVHAGKRRAEDGSHGSRYAGLAALLADALSGTDAPPPSVAPATGKGHPPAFAWTAERKALIARLRDEGRTVTEIMTALGKGVTKGMVNGQLFALARIKERAGTSAVP